MFDCFDNELRYTISVYLLQNCLSCGTTADPVQSMVNFEKTCMNLMCNSDASIIIQKLVEKGF